MVWKIRKHQEVEAMENQEIHEVGDQGNREGLGIAMENQEVRAVENQGSQEVEAGEKQEVGAVANQENQEV